MKYIKTFESHELTNKLISFNIPIVEWGENQLRTLVIFKKK